MRCANKLAPAAEKSNLFRADRQKEAEDVCNSLKGTLVSLELTDAKKGTWPKRVLITVVIELRSKVKAKYPEVIHRKIAKVLKTNVLCEVNETKVTIKYYKKPIF